MQCLLDMDGVLVDFVGGMCRAHGKDPESVTAWDFYIPWGMSEAEFWGPANEGFWSSLQSTDECFDILNEVIEVFGFDNVCLITSPSNNRGCIPGKLRWIEDWLGEAWTDKVLFGRPKHFAACRSRLLIDDSDNNVNAFISGGGRALLVPRPWNQARGVRFVDFLNTINRVKDLHDRA